MCNLDSSKENCLRFEQVAVVQRCFDLAGKNGARAFPFTHKHVIKQLVKHKQP